MDPSRLPSAASAAHSAPLDPFYVVLVVGFLAVMFVAKHIMVRDSMRRWVKKNWPPVQSTDKDDMWLAISRSGRYSCETGR